MEDDIETTLWNWQTVPPTGQGRTQDLARGMGNSSPNRLGAETIFGWGRGNSSPNQRDKKKERERERVRETFHIVKISPTNIHDYTNT